MNDKTRLLLTYNAVLLVMLAAVGALTFLYPTPVVMAAGAVWLVLLIGGNWHVIMRQDDVRTQLRSYDRRHGGMFSTQVFRLIRNDDAITAKGKYFNDQGNIQIYKAYALMANKSRKYLASALGFMEQYDYVTRPQFNQIDRICELSDELVRKLQELSNDCYRINDAASDVDISVIDDLLVALDAMQEDV